MEDQANQISGLVIFWVVNISALISIPALWQELKTVDGASGNNVGDPALIKILIYLWVIASLVCLSYVF